MKVLFVGASGFGLRCVTAMTEIDSIKVVGAITNKREFTISYAPGGVTNVLHADVQAFCEQRQIACYVMQRNMSEPGLSAFVRQCAPDLMVVVGWYHMVPKSLRAIVPAIGLHASLLPDYSGGAPLVWSMINGEKRTGISLFELSDGVDDGRLLGQGETDISAQDTIETLYRRIETIGLQLLLDNLPRLADGTVVYQVQDETRRRVFPQRAPLDGKINWKWPADRVHDFVRAQTRPYPGAFGIVGGQKVTIWSSTLRQQPMADITPGAVVAMDEGIVVGCGGGTSLVLGTIGVDDTDMTAAQWCAGFEGGAGAVFDVNDD